MKNILKQYEKLTKKSSKKGKIRENILKQYETLIKTTKKSKKSKNTNI